MISVAILWNPSILNSRVVPVVIIAKNPINFQKHFINIRTNKNNIKRIKYSYNNQINFNYLHYIQFHRQTLLACLTNAYTCIYTKSLQFGAILRHTRATRTFMDPCGPQHVYAPCRHFSLLFSMFLFSYFLQKDIIIFYTIHNHMTDFPHHHSIIYDFTPPYSPVICKDIFPLIYMYKSSRYYAVFHIDLGPMFPQSTIL